MKSHKTLLRELQIKGDIPVNSSIYPTNKLQLSKYSWLTLLPKNLFQQFQRVANIWFLIVSIFQLLPYQLNPTDSWTTIAPLSILLLISLSQDAYNDFLLSKKLKRLNESVYGIWNGEDFVAVQSQDILVGQIILLNVNDLVPADVILLSRSRLQDSIFLDMTNLLGVSTCEKKKGLDKVEKALGIETEEIGLGCLSGIVKLPEPTPSIRCFFQEVS
jgi:magnesium-transporting ATPase (P-type)